MSRNRTAPRARPMSSPIIGVVPKPKRKGISDALLARLRAQAEQISSTTTSRAYEMPSYLPGVLPDGNTKLAMDSIANQPIGAAYGAVYGGRHGLFAEGIGFYGYPYLAELTQRTEYRRPSEVIAEEMTRKFFKLNATGDKDKSDKIKVLEDLLKHYRIKEKFRQALELDGFMGLSFIQIDLGTNDDWDEMQTPLTIDRTKIARNSLKDFIVIDPTWCAPNDYDASNPLNPKFYKPQKWFVMGKLVHASRMLKFLSRPLPDLLKPAYNFGGLSLSQMMKPYVDNWLKTRQAVNDIIVAFTVFVLETNMQATLAGEEDEGNEVINRAMLFNLTRTNRGMLMIDKNSEAFQNVSVPLGSLDHLQAQAQEHMACPPGIPLVKFFGITPSGLNASSDGEIRVFYDTIKARCERVCGDPAKQVIEILQLNEFGVVDPEITIDWPSLWQLDEAGEAAVRKTDADTDAVLIDRGVLQPEDARQRIAKSDTSPYHGLEGPAPGLPEMTDNPEEGGEPGKPPPRASLRDPGSGIAGAGARGSESGANAGE